MIRYRYRIDEAGAFGVEHHFELATDSTPWHAHAEGFGHSVRLVRGRARLDFKKAKSVTLTKEETHFNVTRVHRLTADAGDTVVFNRVFPVPDDWSRRVREEGEWRCL